MAEPQTTIAVSGAEATKQVMAALFVVASLDECCGLLAT